MPKSELAKLRLEDEANKKVKVANDETDQEVSFREATVDKDHMEKAKPQTEFEAFTYSPAAQSIFNTSMGAEKAAAAEAVAEITAAKRKLPASISAHSAEQVKVKKECLAKVKKLQVLLEKSDAKEKQTWFKHTLNALNLAIKKA